jgi:hypothetical protein
VLLSTPHHRLKAVVQVAFENEGQTGGGGASPAVDGIGAQASAVGVVRALPIWSILERTVEMT